MSLLGFLSHPDIAVALDRPPAPDDSPIRRASWSCGRVLDETRQCVALGGSSLACWSLFAQSRACLGRELAPETVVALERCGAREEWSLSRCGGALERVTRGVEEALEKAARETEMSESEMMAWRGCGDWREARSEMEAGNRVGCSMATVCPRELDTFVECLESKRVDVAAAACAKEGRALLIAFRPYMDKLEAKDPTFFMRGAANDK